MLMWSVAITGVEKVNSKSTRENVEKMYPDKSVFFMCLGKSWYLVINSGGVKQFLRLFQIGLFCH